MSNSEAPISITVKTPAQSLVTVRANNGEELDTTIATALASIESAVKELEGVMRGTVAAPSAMTATAVAAALGASIIDNSQPVAGGRNCPHGRMTAIQGMGKDGKPYKGYFCPAPKGAFDKCKNVYVKVTDMEWNTFVPEQIK